MTSCDDIDGLPSFIDAIEHDVIPDYKPSQTRIDMLRKRSAQKRVLGQGSDTIEQIFNDTLGSGRVFLSDEVEELCSLAQSEIGPQDVIGHYS